LSQKGIAHNARVLAKSPFHKQLTENSKDGRLCQSVASKEKLPELHYDLPQTTCG
jgi:hypothetical protein